jgi:hypothetical protein
MFSPSDKWTDSERQHVAVAIARQMCAQAREKNLVTASQVQDWGERIELLFTRPASFLENNRGAILEGQIAVMH